MCSLRAPVDRSGVGGGEKEAGLQGGHLCFGRISKTLIVLLRHLGDRDSVLVELGSKRLTPAAEGGVFFFSFVLFFCGNLILQCLSRVSVLAAAKRRELYGNHVAKKKQEKLQLGRFFSFLTF